MLLALIAQSVLSSVTVTLPVEANVKGTEIELGELCQVTGMDGEIVGRVRALELGYAPAPGFSRLMTAARIRAELAKAIPGVQVRVVGERACRVWPTIEEIQPVRLEAAARAELVRTFADKEATFTLSDPISIVKVPLGERGSEITARPNITEKKSGIFGVPVEVMVDGARYRTVWTSWRVDVWETRPVLNRPVKAGEELHPDLFARSRVQVNYKANVKSLEPRELMGAIASRDLAPGERVTIHDVHRPAAVTLGGSLFLRVKKGAIEARVSATALDTGSIGQRIRVRTVEAGQELEATIVGRDLCEISL